MESHCPVCGNPLLPHDIVCPACRERIKAREPALRENVLRSWGRSLMLLLAFVFFLKGTYGALSPDEYSRTVRALSLPAKDDATTALNAVFFIGTALLYAISWVGGFARQKWDVAVCLGALLLFVAGQGIVQFALMGQEAGAPRAAALFLFWVAVPIFQYVIFRLGSGKGPAEA